MSRIPILLTLALLLTPNLLISQTTWTRHAANPGFNRGSGNLNDYNALQWSFGPTVHFDVTRNAYLAWFESYTVNGTKIAFSHAISSDGARWYYYSRSPLLEISPGTFDGLEIRGPHVIKDAGGFKMYYLGRNAGGYNIGLATSADGFTWQKYQSNPVLSPGTPGAWDDGGIAFCSVLIINGIYHMWYTGNDGSVSRIGLATSPDGIVWTKHAGNPLLNLGAPGQWDDTIVESPQVVLVNGIYYMMYTGRPDLGTQQIGLATSTDGISWQKYASNPVLTAQGGWEGTSLSAASVLFRAGKFHLWYTGGGNGLQSGYATADLTYPPAPSNFVLNGGFESGVPPWSLFTNGSATFTVVPPGSQSPNAAKISIATQGTNVQLHQTGIVVNPNVLYRLSFDAYSNTGHDLSVFFHRNTSPYTNYGVNNFVCNLTTNWQNFVLYFTSSGFASQTSDSRLRFWLSPYDAAGDIYYIDNVSLTVATGPESERADLVEPLSIVPTEFYLTNNFPNPFNPETVIKFGLPENHHVSIKVYDALGQTVTTLLDEQMVAGEHTVRWDGSQHSSGVYFCRMQAGSFATTLKMALTK